MNFQEDSIKVKTKGVILCHGTSSKAVEAIAKEGLIPKKGKGADSIPSVRRQWDSPLVFLMASRTDTYIWAQCAASVTVGTPVVLEVRIPASSLNRLTYMDFEDGYVWMFEGAIAPAWVSVLPDRPDSPLPYSMFPMMVPPWLGRSLAQGSKHLFF